MGFKLILLLCLCAFVAAGQQSSNLSVSDAAGAKSGDAKNSNEKSAATPDPTPEASAATPTNTAANPPSKKVLVIPSEKASPITLKRFAAPPVIDGNLNDEIWATATVFKDFLQIQPGDNIAPSMPSEVRVGYDSKFLYLAFHAYDEPDKIRATVAKRDDIFADDFIGVFLDTFNDNRRAYEFFFNPHGIQADGIRTEDNGGQNEDFSPDVVMESKGVMTADGYTIEVAIPFKSLRYQAGKGKLWGLNFIRRIQRFNRETDSWMPISREKSGTLNQNGHITGLEDLSTERTLEVIPSFTLGQNGRRESDSQFTNEGIKPDFGLNLKYTLTPNITLDFAYNPDFAQVEADQVVVTANQRFPIFFEEKRPFFLEGKEIFNVILDNVYTRTIADPDYAVKLTGKQGRNTFGVLLASDNAPRGVVPDSGQNAYDAILRFKHDIGKENSLGILVTSFNFPGRHNHVGGFDGRFRLDPQTTFSFQVVGTNSRATFYNPDLDRNEFRTGNALGYAVIYEKQKRNLNYAFSVVGRSRDFRADLGFTRRVNTNLFEFFARRQTEPNPKGKIISFSVATQNGYRFDWQGRVQSWNSGGNVQFQFQRQTSIGGGMDAYYDRVFESEFGARRNSDQVGAFFGGDDERSTYNKQIYMFGNTRPSKKYNANFFIGYGFGAFDYDFGGAPSFRRVSPAALSFGQGVQLDPGAGNQLDAELRLNLQPTDALNVSLAYIKSRLVRRDSGLLAFDDNIYSVRSTYQFTRFTFARARLDYDSLSTNLTGQLLLGWAPNPGTAFYIGYNDALQRYNPFLDQFDGGLRRYGRAVFIKASYLFRKSI